MSCSSMRRPTSVFSVWSPFRRRSHLLDELELFGRPCQRGFRLSRPSPSFASHIVIGVVETTEFLENGFELIRNGWRLFRKPPDILAGFLERHTIGIEPGTQLRRRRVRRVDRLSSPRRSSSCCRPDSSLACRASASRAAASTRARRSATLSTSARRRDSSAELCRNLPDGLPQRLRLSIERAHRVLLAQHHLQLTFGGVERTRRLAMRCSWASKFFSSIARRSICARTV